ncbi:radical SAM protein [Actinomadura darangshiensis]|uniref:Radical SAM protein n=1 Tax=Actinomadura darangshiensis TaxID=705336 RepID=A0A4R5A9W5_9ACTN|nr:radical SAM protein [Actinomadura darangshiensis]TDD68415.1 radical SAM protein [Actinomadura darangshiensis]
MLPKILPALVHPARRSPGSTPAHTSGDSTSRVSGEAPGRTTGHERLLAGVEHATGIPVDAATATRLGAIPETDPNAVAAALTGVLPGRFAVTGTLDRRLLFAERASQASGWTIADLSGQEHLTRSWPQWAQDRIQIATPQTWLSAGEVSEEAAQRLLRPRVLLAALYHPEWFPLPRFPLAISDLARAARSTLIGQVTLMDMQLGATLDDIRAAVDDLAPDVVGVSATFGQHDLMIELLDDLFGSPRPPLVLAGGSLTARNEGLLLKRYPDLMVARGAGEPTIADVLSHFHGDLERDQIRGIGYTGAARGGGLMIARPATRGEQSTLVRPLPSAALRTATLPNRAVTEILPELDLLDATFDHHGVAQLETSRGCTSACSFCPRSHKGKWAPGGAQDLDWILDAMRTVFDRHPGISRTLYLVDEEIIGRGDDAVPRIRAIAAALQAAGLSWESSCRIDQVVRPDRDRDWHLERAQLWRDLVEQGLRRMLFGVESGVSSILERFNKDTTSDQNALAIRTLSALGVPTRYTYITFDHLMDADELAATHAFQGRTDLLLRPLPHLSVEEIIDGIDDPQFVAAHQTGRAFYTGISYMLVSMECLSGAAYTRAVQARGLTRTARPSMGRVDAEFADWRIGACSHHAQLWIDRSFALDYTAKSLEKILNGQPRDLLHQARVTIRHAAYVVLTEMLALIDRYSAQSAGRTEALRLKGNLQAVLDGELAELTTRMATVVNAALPALPDDAQALLKAEYERWRQPQPWRLINAAEACGT